MAGENEAPLHVSPSVNAVNENGNVTVVENIARPLRRLSVAELVLPLPAANHASPPPTNSKRIAWEDSQVPASPAKDSTSSARSVGSSAETAPEKSFLSKMLSIFHPRKSYSPIGGSAPTARLHSTLTSRALIDSVPTTPHSKSLKHKKTSTGSLPASDTVRSNISLHVVGKEDAVAQAGKFRSRLWIRVALVAVSITLAAMAILLVTLFMVKQLGTPGGGTIDLASVPPSQFLQREWLDRFRIVSQQIVRYIDKVEYDDNTLAVRSIPGQQAPLSPGGFYTNGGYTIDLRWLSVANSVLAWGFEKYRMGFEETNTRVQTTEILRKMISFIDNKCWQLRVSSKRYISRIGYPNSTQDEAMWARSPEQLRTASSVQPRVANQLGAEVFEAREIAMDVSAAMASMAQLRPKQKMTLIKHARELLTFAMDTRFSYNKYKKTFGDEFVWAAAWRAYAEKTVGSPLREWPGKFQIGNPKIHPHAFSRNDKALGCLVRLSQDWFLSFYSRRDNFQAQAAQWLNRIVYGTGGYVQRTPGGLLWVDKVSEKEGSLHVAVFTAMTIYQYVDHGMNPADRSGRFARDLIALADKQIRYIFGDNPMKLVYVYGFSVPGARSIRAPHHRLLGQRLPSYPQLRGLLVRGPAKNDQFALNDRVANSVSLDSTVALLVCLQRPAYVSYLRRMANASPTVSSHQNTTSSV
mmetsp:Transcript_11752/g.20002  ORF Transcript_11752/g.20002 Transcript_11752/m.20002 type:complete len:694 (+) Transcript_11752:148-2229(+)